MAKRGRKKKADIVLDLWRKSNNYSRRKWHNDSQEANDFYLNDQLSQDERDALVESGMPDFIINRITPAVDIMKYFVTANNPKWQAIAAEGSDTDIAQLHSAVSEYCWHLSGGKGLFGQVIHDSLVKGVGYFAITVDPDADRGMGEVMFTSVDPYDIYVDPSSRDIMFRDASYIIIQKNMPKDQLIKLMTQYKAKISKASGSPESKQTSSRDKQASQSIQHSDINWADIYDPETGEQQEMIDFYECYARKKVAMVNAYIKNPPSPQQMKEIRSEVQRETEILQEELKVQIQEKQLELQSLVEAGEMIQERASLELEKFQTEAQRQIDEQQASLQSKLIDAKGRIEQTVMDKKVFEKLLEEATFAQQVVDVVEFFQTRIMLTCTAGDAFLYEQELDLEDYPIVPICYTHTGTPYPMGAVTPMIGKQQEINKAHQVMIHNANLASNLRWLYTEGSVDEDEWEKYSSAPGAMLKYRQGFETPTPVQPVPINNAFYTITQEGKQDLEYISGVASQMQGVGEPQHDTYRGMLALDEYGTRRIRQWTNNVVEPALEQMGKLFKTVAQQTYQANKVFRIVQPEAGASDAEVATAELNIPIYNDFGEVIGRWNDYESAKFDIRVVAGSTQPVNRWALQDEYFKWFEGGLIDDIAMVEVTDIRNKKQLLKRKSLYSEMQGQLAQMEENIKELQGENETLERQIVQAGIKLKINEGDKKNQQQYLQTEAEQKLTRQVLKMAQQESKKEVARAKKEAVDSNKKKN